MLPIILIDWKGCKYSESKSGYKVVKFVAMSEPNYKGDKIIRWNKQQPYRVCVQQKERKQTIIEEGIQTQVQLQLLVGECCCATFHPLLLNDDNDSVFLFRCCDGANPVVSTKVQNQSI